MNSCDLCIQKGLTSLKALNKEELESIQNTKTTLIFKKGDALFEEGDTTNGVYCIKAGICKMTKLSANGKDQIVKLAQVGDLIDKRLIISEELSNTSAIALEDMEVCYIPREPILNAFNNNNQFSLLLMRSICSDLKEANEMIMNMAQKSVKSRLAFTLLHLQDQFGIDTDKSLKINLSRDELATLIGTATESAIRLLSELKKARFIDLQGKKILILEPQLLKKMAE
ncbi:Crp/Fnr family transcriptional regulator [Flavobacterium ardleyense]|uniref:Crp/Fnr family transcriptional regulator n=1 Tax=Flavobacterium ardleyense TaxID=2038737 RepID=UPI00298CB76B|nr:Crp/Fnr family transcriptional regulator [Flavobacterium ardleyense]